MSTTENKKYLRFAVGVAMACYELPSDHIVDRGEAAKLVKWVIDMALGPGSDAITVEPMSNYPSASKFPLIIRICGRDEHLMWFYPQLTADAMCDALADTLAELPVVRGNVPA